MHHRLNWSLVLLVLVTVTQVTDVAGRYHHIKLRHGRHRRQHADSYLPSSFVPDTNEPERGTWGPWSPPSSCSRSCGGGVAHQTRQCLDVDENGYDRCTGSKKRFFSCNIQECSNNSADFRAEQCAEYNRVEFEGVFYDWIPYTGGPNKCELNCMPRGERFFYRHKLTVTDGTPCDLEKNDVCVEGKCMPVGCDMMLGSNAREDACRECNGDGSDCNTVKGIFDTDDLQVGYIDTLLIPQGATNVVVKEISPSNNYLAIRNTTGYYYLNGNWRIDFPRSLRFAGTIFHYARDPQGFSAPDTITALGPTTEAIYVVLLYQDKNVGVHYEYSIPNKFSQQGDPDSYTWVADEFSECSSTCGGGYKSRKVVCVRRRNNEPVDENLCDRQLEPDDTEACGNEPCPPEWVESEWGPCSKQCGEGGERTRQIKCEQILAGGIPSIVDDSQCTSSLGPKNETMEKCNENVECPKWHVGPWKPCDHLCGPGKQLRRVTCYRKNEETGKIEALEDSACSEDPLPEREKACESRPCDGLDWIATEWSGCEEKCGLTQETRTAHCATLDGKTYPDEKCDVNKKPELIRKCDNPKSCDYLWYTSQWSECSAKCGKGIRSRTVFCATFDGGETLKKVENDKCDSAKKFNDTEECEAEVEECKGEWFAGPWSKCSKPCGGGDATRKVICLRDGTVVPTTNCEIDTIMFGSETCNDFTCGEDEVIPVEPGQTQVPTDEDEECEVYEDEEEDFVTFDSRLGSDSENEISPSGETLSSFDKAFTDVDDMMLSDSPHSRGDITPVDSGSGSGYGSGDDEYTGDIFSTIYHTDSSFSTIDMSSVEGSGASTDETSTDLDGIFSSEFTELPTSQVSAESESTGATTEVGESAKTTESGESAATTEASESAKTTEAGESTATTESISESTDVSGLAETSDKTTGASVTSQSIDSSDTTVEGSTESAASAETPGNTDSSEGSSESATELTSEAVTESASDFTTESETGTTDSATSDSSSSDMSTEMTGSSSSDSSESTEATESTETTVTESTESTPTDITESSSSTDSTVSSGTDDTTVDSTTIEFSETTDQSATTTSSDVSETSSEISSETGFTLGDVQGEYDPDKKTESSIIETESTSGSDVTTDATTAESVTDGSTESSATDETGSTEDVTTFETTTSAASDGSSEMTDETAESGATTEFAESTESEATTESGASTESGGTTESGASTESGATTESGESTESGATTESGGSTETEATSESGTTFESSTESVTGTSTSESEISTSSDESTVSGETSATSETVTTSSDMTTESTDDWDDLTGQSHITDLWTTVNPVDAAITSEHKLRKCKVPKKKSCKKSAFGCCYDGVTPAQGPFDKGCPTPKTCAETIYSCCPDGVSPAAGPNNEDCPFSHCNETLFGCCPDGIGVAEGNENEGCKKACNETEFGCCPDKETAASGKDNLGCCNATTYGCCPDGIRAASGVDLEGCEDEQTTFVTSWTEVETDEYETTTTTGFTSEPIDEDCANSTYGCCPNGRKFATGINFAGCGIIDNENCTASYFGCCPDGAATALGPNATGCHTLCENTTYGCCEDNSSPAHGHNQEGCCLTSTYGCCPDNISPARGPDFYGCGCEYSRFRCCPDNTTAARGANNEGCGCQYTPHGCCPNRFTPANGPNFEGCPCYTYQFGCCPDGVTIAKGPHSQGCGCENTEFKCCSDDRTPAKGPNFAGCTCESSKYGCCLDGVEEAQGENFEGCLSIPTNPGAACALARDRGPCRDFTVKWFFDTEYGGCSRFWYGGCDGNDNRFKTQEECKDVCVQPAGKDACYLPKISGPCEGYYPNWYYDSERKQCGQFIYGGCLGNGNRFETREQCEGLCTVPDNIDPCDQSKESGPCQGNFTRWHFNKDRQACEPFKYGGCKANDNNYPTEIACHQQCLQPGHSRVTTVTAQNECALVRDPGPCPGSLLRWYHDTTSRSCRQFVYGGCKGNAKKFRTRADCERRCSIRDSCSLPRDEGNCTEKHSRWFFDRSENRCMPFYYTGCGGNRNNFDSRDACESDCPPKIEQDICLLPALLGECQNYTQRWFYDSYEQRCRQFYYGGCGGNGNNFATEHDCAGRCEKSRSTPAPPATEFRTEFCFLPDERGSCTENHVKWFYDSRDGICKQFQYGGCDGNGNRFESREECDYRCGEVQDACAMPKVVGPCNGFVKQFYYDRRSDTCEEFEYSGCAGNKNRFQERDACETKCRRRSEHPRNNETTTSSPTPTQVLPTSPICLAPVDAGPCDGDVTAYYYDSMSKSCQAFIYGGCKGNANRFQTEEQCERLCGRFQGHDSCNLPADTGPCRGAFPKIFYDPSARTCREFIYGGCDGNANRFSTVPECESVCLHHEEPAPAGNDTALSHFEICRETVDIGSCSAGNYKRFYFDEERQTCMPFLYTGCGGNLNNFKTFESCLNTCFRTSNEIDVGTDTGSKDPCAEAHEECGIIRCPYGKEAYVDDHDCQRCRCVDPCRVLYCPEGTRCSITLVATGDGTEYRGVCRSTVKPGNCPIVSNSTRCERECATDADCNGDTKCCNNGCGTSCLEPAAEEPPTTLAPIFNVTVPQFGADPAVIKEPEEPRVSAEEGGYVTMTCVATGNPRPVITWRKDTTVINPSEKRRRILTDGSLQIVNLYSYDRGTYVCTADNGLAPPARTEYQLEVTEPHEHSAAIVGEPSTFVTVTMNSPTVLHCYAIGWPRPFVTWWRGDRMLPLSSEYYEQDSDYTLLIRSVTITNLGVYTCQAYNGIQRPASWSVTLQAIGPVHNIRPDQMEYAKYLVQPPKRPDRPTTDRPQYPYRPIRTQAPANQTYIPIYQTVAPPYRPPVTPRPVPTPPRVIPIMTVAPPSYPNRYRVRVSVNVTTEQTEYPVGSDISIGCSVDGYPIPTVLWYKNNELVRTDERIKISESNRLVISNAANNDTGTYRCEATNDDSRSASSIDVRVDGLYIHPDCQDNAFFAKCDLIVFAKYCQHTYYAKFCCRSCTEAGQLAVRGPHLDAARKRRRRSALERWFV